MKKIIISTYGKKEIPYHHVRILLDSCLWVHRILLDFQFKSVSCCIQKVLYMRTGQIVVQTLLVLPVLNLHVGDLLGIGISDILGHFPVELDIDEPRTCLQRCLHID